LSCNELLVHDVTGPSSGAINNRIESTEAFDNDFADITGDDSGYFTLHRDNGAGSYLYYVLP
jgi:hypothetical protein